MKGNAVSIKPLSSSSLLLISISRYVAYYFIFFDPKSTIEQTSTGDIKDICQQLLMKWMYYTNLILNDLSARCVRSLGIHNSFSSFKMIC